MLTRTERLNYLFQSLLSIKHDKGGVNRKMAITLQKELNNAFTDYINDMPLVDGFDKNDAIEMATRVLAKDNPGLVFTIVDIHFSKLDILFNLDNRCLLSAKTWYFDDSCLHIYVDVAARKGVRRHAIRVNNRGVVHSFEFFKQLCEVIVGNNGYLNCIGIGKLVEVLQNKKIEYTEYPIKQTKSAVLTLALCRKHGAKLLRMLNKDVFGIVLRKMWELRYNGLVKR